MKSRGDRKHSEGYNIDCNSLYFFVLREGNYVFQKLKYVSKGTLLVQKVAGTKSRGD